MQEELRRQIAAIYSKIPEKDSLGLTNQRARFMEWNPDPIGNEAANLAAINPELAKVVRRAQQISGVKFVVGSGKRDAAMQEKAKKWGWSKTLDSDHLGGNATDLWPLDEDGAIVFDPARQAKIAAAMKQSAQELGVQLDVGADWKHPDRPHFGIKVPAPQPAAPGAAPQPQTASNMGQDELRRLIVETANAIGANPTDLATAISYETAGTFDPLKSGPHTQWGTHRGLIQFGEPQARQFGVDWNDPLHSQLGAEGAVAKYFKASGFKPGMSGLDLYSTINAGAPGRYGASDAHNGGAPGDVRDKWETQMAAHRAKAERLLDPYDTFADGPKGQEAFQPMLGSMAPGGMMAQDNSVDPNVASYAFSEDTPGVGDRLQAAGKAFSNAASAVKAPRIAAMPSPSGDVANGLAKLMQNPQALAQLLMKQRLG